MLADVPVAEHSAGHAQACFDLARGKRPAEDRPKIAVILLHLFEPVVLVGGKGARLRQRLLDEVGGVPAARRVLLACCCELLKPELASAVADPFSAVTGVIAVSRSVRRSRFSKVMVPLSA